MKINNIINKENKRFYWNTIMQYIMTFAQYVFPLITFPYLTRVLEPDLYGVITYMTATITYFQLVIDFGFNLSATKEIAEKQEDKKHIGMVLGSVIQAKIFLLIGSFIVYILMVQFIPKLNENKLLAYLYMGTVVLSIWLPDYMFRGIEKMEIITVRFLLSKMVTTVLTFVLVRSKSDMLWIPILNMIGSLVAICLTWHHIKTKLKIKVRYTSKVEVISKLKESFLYFLSTFATTAFGAMNTFMLGAMNLPSSQIAYWGVSYTLIGAAQSLYTPIINSLYPHMINKKDFKLVRKLLYIFMPAIIVTTIIVYMLSELVITIFSGPEYMEAIPVFKALLPVLILSFPAMVIDFPVLAAFGKVKETTITTIISSVFHILGLLLLALIGKFTVLAVAILRSATELVLLATRSFVLIKNKKR